MQINYREFAGISICFLFILILSGCDNPERQKVTEEIPDTIDVQDEPEVEIEVRQPTDSLPEIKYYANERFKEVTVEEIGKHTFLIRGKAQIFEASFSWIVEDGHNELKKGYQMTDAGAPEWGNFSFAVEVHKKRENSTLMLVLFESSPKDGSRQHELPVLLY
jgi:hypothetical protein